MRDPKVPPGHKRDPKWPAFERRFLKGKVCAGCGGKKHINVRRDTEEWAAKIRERP